MPSPTSSLATLRPDLAGSLEEFNLAQDRQGFIGTQVLPIMDVAKASGNFGTIPIEQLLQERTTLRAPGGSYSRGNFQFTPGSYATVEYGAEEPVDDNQSVAYRDYFIAEQISAQRALDAVLREWEKRVAAAVFNATTWTSNTTAISSAVRWDVKADAAPIDQIDAAKRKVWDASGIWPNTVIMSRKNFMNLRLCDQIRERVASTGAGDSVLQKRITVQQIAQAFDIEKVLIGNSAKNTENEGQDVTIAPIWSDTEVMVCRTAMTNDFREVAIGRNFHWAEDGSSPGGTMESYRDETIRGDVIRARIQVQEKILYVPAGHLLTTVTG